MTLFIIGALLLGFVLGLFWIKDRLESHALARIAYSEFNMRLAVIAAALMAIGVLLMVADLIGWR